MALVPEREMCRPAKPANTFSEISEYPWDKFPVRHPSEPIYLFKDVIFFTIVYSIYGVYDMKINPPLNRPGKDHFPEK